MRRHRAEQSVASVASVAVHYGVLCTNAPVSVQWAAPKLGIDSGMNYLEGRTAKTG